MTKTLATQFVKELKMHQSGKEREKNKKGDFVMTKSKIWEDSPAEWPQSRPYAWWRRHDEYGDGK